MARDTAGSAATGRDPAGPPAVPARQTADTHHGTPGRSQDAAAAGDPREAAVRLWEESVATGRPLSGAELGRRVGRSESWGRKLLADLQRDDEAQELGEPRDPAGEARPVPWPARAVRVAALAIVIAAAAVVSFDHHRHVAASLGEGWRSWLLPLSIDGMIVVASITAWERHRLALRVGGWVWCSLTLGIVASVVGNVAAAEPTPGAWLIAAWPPAALKLTLAMLLTQTRPRARQGE